MVLSSRSSFSSASVFALLDFLEKTSSPFLRNCVFQVVIWAGWILCFLPSSCMVERSDNASSTTLNLNFDVCFLRVIIPVSYTHLRAHETDSYLVCRLLLEKK